MTNKELAEALIVRFAGVPCRHLTQEAAKRLLQMAPDHEFKVPQEAQGLREMAREWPIKGSPHLGPDWPNDYLRSLCTAAADRIEQMAETIDYARTINAENVRLKIELEKIKRERDDLLRILRKHGGCGFCSCGERISDHGSA